MRSLVLPLALVAVLVGALAVEASATGPLPRSLLRAVERACVADARLTGHPFPCLSVTPDGPSGPGSVILRAPRERTHVVLVPTRRITGLEEVVVPSGPGGGYLAQAWAARAHVGRALGRDLPWDATGLAVNSGLTRSQDQLHVHVDCVRPKVLDALRRQVGGIPSDRWREAGFSYRGHPFWARRVAEGSLGSTDPFGLASEIPEVRAQPHAVTFALIGAERGSTKTTVALVGVSDPWQDRSQFTAEHLLDHSCSGVGTS